MVGQTPPFVLRYVGALCVLAVLATSCTSASSNDETSTTTPATTTTTTMAAITSTSPPPTTTTTEAPVVPVVVTGDMAPAMARTLSEAMTALRDPRAAGPLLDTVAIHHGSGVPLADAYEAEIATAELADGSQVASAVLDSGDVVVLADDSEDGWTVVGTHLRSAAAAPYFGESPRRVLVLGSDARPGQNPLVFRMDSIHILTASPEATSGAILGYPRDTWIDSPYGPMRVNALTSSGRGPEAIFDHFTDTWDLPLEGYIVTGFAGFEDLVAATLGRLELVIPIPIPTQEYFAGFRSGEQTLTPTRTLDFARTRKLIPGGDFTRSFHQGIVMLAALTMIQRGSILDLPVLLAELSEHTTTNLTATDLVQLGAAAMEMDIGSITNEVLPGSLGRSSGGASVVFLDEGYEDIVDDVIDDGLRNGSTQP